MRISDWSSDVCSSDLIKVDKGTKPLPFAPDETITEGLDGLRERCAEYRTIGARFAKWRAVIRIGHGLPTGDCIQTNAHALARYAAIAHETGLLPIGAPQVPMPGAHGLAGRGRRTEQGGGGVSDGP